MKKIDNTTQKIVVYEFIPETNWTDVIIIIENTTIPDGNSANFNFTYSGSVVSIHQQYGNPGYVVTIHTQDNIVRTNDYLLITTKSDKDFMSGSSYKITILYAPTGASIDVKSFTR